MLKPFSTCFCNCTLHLGQYINFVKDARGSSLTPHNGHLYLKLKKTPKKISDIMKTYPNIAQLE